MFEVFLSAHFLGGILTGVAGAYAVVILWNGAAERYRIAALILGGLAAFEVATGTLLAVISADLYAISVCGRLALYLTLVAIIELGLYIRMKKISLVFPTRAVVSPVTGTLFAFLTALALRV